MTKSPKELFQHWVHSHEEDTSAEMVFRPATFKFPRSRGRLSFELKTDGNMVQHRIGSTDRSEALRGNWKLEGNRLLLITDPNSPPERILEIAVLSHDRLVVRK
jgi:hypothetical protein